MAYVNNLEEAMSGTDKGRSHMTKCKYVYGNEKRIFVNTDLGCQYGCKYCYLPSLNIVREEKRISAAEVIQMVNEFEHYIAGENGSIISIGCYSECMDAENINETLKIIKYFVAKGNYVQLATKKKIPDYFFEEVTTYSGIKKLLWLNISIPVVSRYKELENNTDSPFERMENFSKCNKYGIHCVLYIKPFLIDATERDFKIFSDIVLRHKLPVVVGNFLSIEPSKEQTLVGEQKLYEHPVDNKWFIDGLRELTDVFSNSTDCIEAYRGMNER